MTRIPNVLHYCFGMTEDFGGKPWSLIHFVCIRSAIERLRPSDVFLYYEFEPQGPWWDLTRPLITPIRIKAPDQIFDRPVKHPAHKADVIRIEKLLQHGGIYLDADVFVHRNFDDLLEHSMVMGREGDHGIANAVMLAEPDAPFLRRWYNEYRSFRGTGFKGPFWNEHSVKMPAKLAHEHPGEIKILPPTAFFWPLWDSKGLRLLFEERTPIPLDNVYANHLWEAAAWPHLKYLTPGQVRRRNGNFHTWARPFVEDLPDNLGEAPLKERLVDEWWTCIASLRAHSTRYRRRMGRTLRRVILGSKQLHGKSSEPSTVSRRRVFEDVYDRGLWGRSAECKGFYSGIGSRGAAAAEYAEHIVDVLRGHEEELGRPITIVDIGCGDFEIGRAITARMPSARYIGCDIVRSLIEHHRERFSTQNISFECLDIVSHPPPLGDICLIRQVFQHLSNRDIKDALRNIRGYRAVYVTEGQPSILRGPVNPDKAAGADVRFDWRSGIGRGVELGKPPYNLPTEEMFRTFAPPHETIVTWRVAVAQER